MIELGAPIQEAQSDLKGKEMEEKKDGGTREAVKKGVLSLGSCGKTETVRGGGG